MKKIIFLILLFILLAAGVAAAQGARESGAISHYGIATTRTAGQ